VTTIVLQNATTFGVLEMTLRPGGHDGRFVAEAGASFTDQRSQPCH
jgi:hypothetical protein